MEDWLKGVADGSRSIASMREWLIALIIGDSVDVADEDNDLVMDVVYKLDDTPDDRFVADAQATLAVLTSVLGNQQARALLTLAWQRNGLIKVLDKHLAGVIRDSDFDAFVRGQDWPPPLLEKVRSLSPTGVQKLLGSLREQDYVSLAQLLLSQQ
jgi:hypothetical protein